MQKVSALFFLLMMIGSALFSEEMSKKYYNNVFHGGKERLVFFNADDGKYIRILNCKINADLYDSYALVNLEYEIYCKDKDVKLDFLYPKVDSIINKNIYTVFEKTTDEVKVKNQQYKIEGNYENFKMSVNDVNQKFTMEKSDMLELEIPYKLGDEREYFDESSNLYKESVESYTFLYGWYKAGLVFKSGEKKKIVISYKSGYYYNEIMFDKSKNDVEVEDPALSYDYSEIANEKSGISDRVFVFNLYTSYSRDEKPVEHTYVKIIPHIIDRDFLKIMPAGFKRSGISYYWKYKNLKAKQINNITVSIFSTNSERMIDPKDFKVNLSKRSEFYELEKKNEMIFEYRPVSEDKKSAAVSEIRMVPDYFGTKDQVRKTNYPREIEISFSMTEDFSGANKIVKKFKEKDFIRLINKKNYLSLYKGRELECRFIRIKILKTVDDNNDVVKIRDIEILRK